MKMFLIELIFIILKTKILMSVNLVSCMNLCCACLCKSM